VRLNEINGRYCLLKKTGGKTNEKEILGVGVELLIGGVFSAGLLC